MKFDWNECNLKMVMNECAVVQLGLTFVGLVLHCGL